MLEEFVIPKHSLGRSGLQEVDTNACTAADVLDDLVENDPLYITEDDNYGRCEAVARDFLRLTPSQKTAAIDVLAANLSSISTSAKGLLSDGESASPSAAMRHRNGIQMVVCLLHSIAMQAVKDSQLAKGAENVTKSRATGRGRKSALESNVADGIWDWEQSKQHMLTAVRDLIMLVDLRSLFKGLAAAQRLINLCLELALQGLKAPTIVKQESNWSACRDVLVRGAVHYQQIEFIADELMELVRKHEHMPQLAALIAKHAEEHHNNTQLGVMLLSRFTAVAPEEYDAQYGPNQVSVRWAGDFVASLAELMPKVVSNHFSQLQAYLGCSKAYCLRGALLQATGSILLQVYRTDNLSSSLGAGAVQAHLRSKEALLALLHARILDKVSFVRQKVLQIWAKLVEESCVPLSHWNTLLQEAIARLEDDSQLVVKAALQLLYKMVHKGIFQPPLKTQVYINTLEQTEAELAKLQPAKAAKSSGADAENEADSDNAEDDADSESAHWEKGAIQLEEEQVQPHEDQHSTPREAPTTEDSSKPRNDAAVERLRAMVASLKEGVSFCKRLTATLPQLQVLLANPAANLVNDAIVFLTLCRTFEVTGASEALRGMWPLVFSKHEPVRASVLESWHVLHLRNRLPKQQMEELVYNVIPNCSLSQLTALEAIITALVQQGTLSAVNLMKQAICQAGDATLRLHRAKYEAANCKNAGIDGSCEEINVEYERHRDRLNEARRSAFTLISMLTAAQPSALVPAYVPVLLELGLVLDPKSDFAAIQDAWVTRHTCLALQYAAAHLTAAAADAPTVSSSTQMTPELHQNVLAALIRLLVANPAAAMSSNWPTAAEAAVAALYALAAEPQELMAAVLDEMFKRCIPGDTTGVDSLMFGFSAAALSRFFFVLGQTGLQHLLCIEQTSKAIRANRLAADRAAAEAFERQLAAATGGGSGGGSRKGKGAAAAAQPVSEDIGAQLGVGSVAADAELDALAERIESQILAKDQLLGKYGQLLSRFLHLKSALSAPQALQESALLALTQLMAVDASFCADNLRLLFTLLLQRHVTAPVRVNMVVALADLASRFPNLLEPWTAEMYLTLADPEPTVRLSALSSLTHLVLGGMVKAKGRDVAQVAVLLVDDVQEISDHAELFFQSLAKTGSGNTRSASAAAGASAANPVYNLLPDCLSTLLAMKNLREEQLQFIMQSLLAYVKDKQAESLRERLVARLQVGGPREWRLVAWCIGQLGYTEKGLRRIMELIACYRHALGEQQVYDMFMGLAEKARRSLGGSKAAAAASEEASSSMPGAAGDLCTAVTDWVADLNNSRQAAIEAAEVEAMEAARKQKQEQELQKEKRNQQGSDESQEDAGDQQGQEEQMQDEHKLDMSPGSPMDASSGDADATETVDETGPAEQAQGVGSSGGGEDEEQIELLQQSQAVDDEEPEQLSSEATALRKQMERLGMAPTPHTVARRSQRPSSATAAAAARKGAAKSGLQRTGRKTAAGAAQHTRRQRGRLCKDVDSSSNEEDSDDDSGDDGSKFEAAAESAAASAAGRAKSRSRGSSAAAGGQAAVPVNSTNNVPVAQQASSHGDSYSDSEDDD